VNAPEDDPDHPRGGKRAYMISVIILIAVAAMVLGAYLVDPH
jgi:hypothetical protein